MQLPKSLVLAMAAGAALSANAFAQQQDHVISNDLARPVAPGMIHGGGYAQTGYGSRVDLDVFRVGIPSESGGDWRSSGVNVYDDVTFGGPAGSGPQSIVVNGIALGFIVPASATAADDHLYTLLSFYPNHDNTVAGTTYAYSGTPVTWNLDWGAGWSAAAGFISYYPNCVTFGGSVTLDTTNVLNGGATDRTCGVKAQLFLDAAETRTADNWQIVRRGVIPDNGTNITIPVGRTDIYGWFSAATAPGTDMTNSQRSGAAANSRATYMDLQGTGYTPGAPTPEFAFGNLADGATTHAITIATGTPKWYTFAITADATDNLEHFLDIDTEGSAADLAIAVYDSTGNMLQFDRDSGSGANAMLSFGMGRRAAVGDGRQYDGRNFYAVAGLAAGTYYLAVGPNDTQFVSGFGVTSPGAAGGTGSINFHTNVNGAALAPSVAPVPATGDDLGTLPAGGAPFPGAALDSYNIRWIKFTTCADASGSNPVTFDWTGTSSAGFSATVFDGAGNFVTQEIFAGNGQPTNLVVSSGMPAGTYYLGLGYAGVQMQPNNPTTDGRWHLRGTTGNNGFNYAGAIIQSTCGSNVCCLSDYNGDGDTGTDADIEAFFACLGGNCCATCPPDSDYNCDGDAGTDADIESFFRVLAGGNC